MTLDSGIVSEELINVVIVPLNKVKGRNPIVRPIRVVSC